MASDTPIIKFFRLRPNTDEDIPLPRYMTPQAAGMDIFAACGKEVTLEPGSICLIPTGFAMALPEGFEAQIRPRSGLAVKHGIGLVNSPGTIDADYRGEVMIALVNFGKQPYTVRRGDRIAQMIINRIYRAGIDIVDRLDETGRGHGGFGHTGV
ncbi:MAG: dUTP diphosphatase [Deltaproteobacteria bacterium]|nr:dUTP diphosphatase [Deltaproteobacteria bacterium]MBW1959853.1 dUTP diphosphatase [Deltaproteobacteria bacterium]MBW1993214.1 dUTP diphosphatase [Deltaproteobacteria bacterium]MBW2150367.1 dUTP diphosphatase [Deltaproteobacteria bacterium]